MMIAVGIRGRKAAEKAPSVIRKSMLEQDRLTLAKKADALVTGWKQELAGPPGATGPRHPTKLGKVSGKGQQSIAYKLVDQRQKAVVAPRGFPRLRARTRTRSPGCVRC